VFNFLTEVSFSDLLHLNKDHGRDFFGGKSLNTNSGHLNTDVRLSTLGNDVVREPLEISLDFFIIKLATDKTLDDIDGSLHVVGSLILGRLSNKSLLVGESDVRGGDSVTELILDDLNTSVLENTDTRVGSSEIDTNDGAIDFVFLVFLFFLLSIDCNSANKSSKEER